MWSEDRRLKVTQQTHEHDNDTDGEDGLVGDVFPGLVNL